MLCVYRWLLTIEMCNHCDYCSFFLLDDKFSLFFLCFLFLERRSRNIGSFENFVAKGNNSRTIGCFRVNVPSNYVAYRFFKLYASSGIE